MSSISKGITNLFLKKYNFGLPNIIAVRSLKSALKIKWVRPVKKPFSHPDNTGDESAITKYSPSQLMLGFKNSKELETADDNVKKIFQLELNNARCKLTLYRHELADTVRRHPFDKHSHEVYIANMTANIRYLQEHMANNPKDIKKKVKLQHFIDKRKRQLTHLRRWDYKRFEWLLEKLNIVYRPYPQIYDRITRKKSLTALTTLHCEELKQKRIAEYRKKMNEQKVPFLENKVSKLKWIREQEIKFKMAETVTEKDIEECAQQLEQVRIEVEEMKNQIHAKAIHPYTLETYDPEALKKVEESQPPST